MFPKQCQRLICRSFSVLSTITALWLGVLALNGQSVAQPRFDVWTTNAPTGSYFGSAVDPRNSNIIYTGATTFSVLKSVDNGATWTPSGAGLGDLALRIRIDPTNSKIVYAGTSIGGFKSTDGGDNWSQMFQGNIQEFEIAPSNPKVIYALGTELYVTFDGGRIWRARPLPIANNQQFALAVHPTDPRTIFASLNNYDDQGIYRSYDGGESWHYAGFLGYCNALKYSANTLYAGGSNQTFWGIYKSTDDGDSWSFSQSHKTPNEILSIAIDPIDPANIYVGTWTGGILRTTNGGNTWSTFNNGMPVPFPLIWELTMDSTGRFLHAATWPSYNSGGVGGIYSVRVRRTH